jgi:hypothetical protein
MASFSTNSWITTSLTGPSKHCSTTVMTCSSSVPHLQSLQIVGKPHPELVGVSESLPLLCSEWCGPIIGHCTVLGITSSFRLLTGASTAPVLFFLAALPPGVVTPVPLIQNP